MLTILHLGQGANQAIEDGIALATILTRADTASASACLLAYERLRRERVAEVQLGARRHGLRVDSMVDDLRKRAADLLAHAEFRKQLYSYDVVPHAEAAAKAAGLTMRLSMKKMRLCPGPSVGQDHSICPEGIL